MVRELSSPPLVAWGNAWLAGQAGLDDAVDAVERRTGPNTIGTTAAPELPVEPGASLRSTLARLRPLGLSAFRLCLPVPGDPLGLVGAADLNTAAIEAREAVLIRLKDRQIGLVPSEDRRGSSYVGVAWAPYPAADAAPEPMQLAEAEYRLTLAMRESTDLFGRVDDISGWGPEVESALDALRDPARAPGDGLAPGYPQRAHRLAAQADRLAVVVRLAERDHRDSGRGLSAAQAAARREALRVLDSAVRRAQVAAYGAACGG
ncbi:hypothetical protein CDO52_03230 [Nocardiopsis gilva YIM 90087]|uniref:Uncharacterized protein n=1 Tax=Nocardiopsis gilva YIM 90087 TaxID=1235441 RepID=A0A223S1D0_9ACTN|nr:hypothetical protein [Nocardiopsis gilva]ASU81921.1 hypothetical protein CDO52_03230 [Nocardiopsis gilva YIM 90087]